jgi:hypothetical protein
MACRRIEIKWYKRERNTGNKRRMGEMPYRERANDGRHREGKTLHALSMVLYLSALSSVQCV